MNKNYKHIILIIWCGLLWSSHTNAAIKIDLELSIIAIANDSINPREKDSTKTKKVDQAHLAHLQQMAALRQQSGLATTLSRSIEKKLDVEAVKKTFRSFPTLDEKLIENKDFNVSFAQLKPEFTPAFIEANFDTSPKADTLMAKAKRAFEAVAELGNFVDIITGNTLLELPVGLSKKDSTSGNSVQLAITQVKFTPQYAELKAWGKLTIPQKGGNGAPERDLFFGAEGIKLSHDGALVGDMRLVLLGNQAIPINGDNWLLTLKGGVNLKTDGAFSDQSYVEFDCSGLKSISLEGDVRVSRNVLLPIDDDGNYVCGDSKDTQFQKDKDKVIDNKCYVGASFDVNANGWNDILLTVDLPRFEVQGLKGWGFNLESVTMDLSDSQSAPDLVLPQEYNSQYAGGDRKLWRGFFAKEVSVMLPKGIENTKTSNKRVEFGAKNLVLDNQGVSGTFFADNVLQTGDGAAGKWAFTIEDVSVTLASNSLTGGSIGGDIAVPIFKDPMDYSGYISSNGYGLEVGLQKDYTTPVFLGEMQLEENSSVAINVKDGNVYPYANLTGKLAIAGKINQKEGEEPPANADSEDKKGFAFSGITFQELELQTEPGKDAIKAKSFGYEGEMKLMNFPASIGDLKLITPNNQVGLSFDLKINLDDGGSHATTSLDILGKLDDGAKIQEWKFEKVKVDGISIDYTKGDFNIKGGLEILEDDPVYGDGFAGELTATFNELNFSASGKAMFGKTDFRYWFVDIWTNKTDGKKDSKFLISAFVGGVSSKMKKVSGNNGGWNPGSAVYQPDKDTGLGVRAGVEIGSENSSTFRAKAYLEMEYNVHGGLNRIGFMGEGALMGEDNAPPEDPIEIENTANKVETAIADGGATKEDVNNGNYLEVAQEAIPVHDVAASGKIGIFVGIEKDFVNETFKGEFELYLDLAGIKGGGENNLAGYASILTSPTKWHIYVGTPSKPLYFVFNTGVEIGVSGYFMTGNDLPTQLDPHPQVVEILGKDFLNGERKDNQLIAGRGFAFGLGFSYGYAWDKALFYASVKVGAGFDVMHAHYDNVKCKGRVGPVGNDGWYSMGQVWAYIHGEFGVKVNLAFIKGNFPIAEAGVAAMLRGQFPNPVYFQGYVGMYYNILGGLVSGRMRMKVEMGEECEFENFSNAIGVPMISDITPGNNADDVSVFTAPQAVFNYAANQGFTVEMDDQIRIFKLQLQNYTVTSEGQQIEGELEWNDTNDAVTFKPTETLPSEKEVKIVVEVSFDEKIGGSFQTMIEDGKPVIEKKEITFVTDKAPDYIPWENIAYIYPIRDQQSFYPEEHTQGYVKMKQPQNYLFEAGYEIRAEFLSYGSGNGIRTNISYDRSSSTVFYDLPVMELNAPYNLNVIAFPPGAEVASEIVIEQTELLSDAEAGDTAWYNPNTEQQEENRDTSASAVVSNKKASDVTLSNGAPKTILEYGYKTSKHASFGEKINALVVTNTLTNPITDDLVSLSIKVADYEYFDALELYGNEFTNSKPLISAEAILEDPYYRVKIGPLLYNADVYPLDGNIYVNRDEEILGAPPIQSFYIADEYKAYLPTGSNSTWVKNRIPFTYDLPRQYKRDLDYFHNTVFSRYSETDGDLTKYNSFKYLKQTFPPMPIWDSYKAKLIYRTPGDISVKGYEIIYKND